MLKILAAITLIGIGGGVDMRSQEVMGRMQAAPAAPVVNVVWVKCDRMRKAQRKECRAAKVPA